MKVLVAASLLASASAFSPASQTGMSRIVCAVGLDRISLKSRPVSFSRLNAPTFAGRNQAVPIFSCIEVLKFNAGFGLVIASSH